ncbi:MAG: response regulator [Lachnospiraceae bacterium]|nr:response regulator [Lachnospiraceae bacterium]
MKKVLIIGELSSTEKNLSDYLSGEYQTQLCTRQLDNIQAMTGILKPDLAILSQANEISDQPILDWFQEKHAKIPVLLILSSKNTQGFKELLEKEQFEKLTPPINKTTLQSKCRQFLQKSRPARSKPGKKKILIVDDTPIMLRNLKKMLDSQYEVVLATSGKQALHLLPQEEPDLVLLDYEMPEMNGKEVFETMLGDEDLKYIPVVFLTSVSDRKAVFSILQSKPAGYILKPADQENLLKTVQEILRK